MAGKEITVKCRNCGRSAKANEFILDHVFKMMVCPTCVKERTQGEDVHKEVKKQREEAKIERMDKPAGWDRVDDYLDMKHRDRMSSTVPAVKIDDEHVRMKCQRCNYGFNVNVVRKTPGNCPFCGVDITKLRFG